MKGISDRIETAGKGASIKVGVSSAGSAVSAGVAGAGADTSKAAGAAGGIDADRIGAQMAGAGSKISAGISAGVSAGLGKAGAAVAQSVARIEVMMDKLAGVAVATFRRIDKSMKFNALNASLKALDAKLQGMGANTASLFLRGGMALLRFKNYLSGTGDVGKASYSKLFESQNIFVAGLKGAARAVMGLGKAIGNIATLGAFRKAGTDAKGLGGTVGKVTGGIKGLGRELLVAFGVAGVIYKTVGFLKDGVKAASDLGETVSRTKVVFGSAFGPIEAQAKSLNRAFGISRNATMDIASGFGAMAQGAGLSEAKSAELAGTLTQMAADLSSSVNISFEEAGEKIRSALAGEAEPLRRFGANITETNVQAYALAHGIAASAKSMTDQQKIAARAGLIVQGLSYAQGDLARTSDSAANQFRKAGGGVEAFGLRIGELLMPAVQAGTVAFSDFLAGILDFTEAAAPTITGWVDGVAEAFGTVGLIVRNWGSVWETLKLRIGGFVENTMAYIAVLPENFGRITAWIGRNWSSLIDDLAKAEMVGFSNLLDNAAAFGEALMKAIQGQPWEFTWKPLLDGFRATTEALPELLKPALVDVDAEVNRIWGKIAEKEAERAAALAQKKTPTPKRPGEVKEPEKAAEYKFASAVEIGSKEAYSIIARSLNPHQGGIERIAGQQLVVQRDAVAKLNEIANQGRRPGPVLAVK